MERIAQIHLAGGRRAMGLWIDSHDHPIHDEVLELLAHVASRAPKLRAVILEWDAEIPSFDVVREELARATEVLTKAGRR